jgi:site-specific DNA recombinase
LQKCNGSLPHTASPGERSWKHKHYLSGSLFCARCGSRLLFGIHTGRRGDMYEYFFCAGRHSGRTECDLPWLPLEQVEEAVARQWDTETFPEALIRRLRKQLTDDLHAFNAGTADEHRRLTQRIAHIRRERYKWAEKAMEGTVPADIVREKQQQLSDQLLAAESALAQLSVSQDSHEATLNAVLNLAERCGGAYRQSDTSGRRDYNQAWFEQLYLDADDDRSRPSVTKVTRTPLIAALQVHRDDGTQPTQKRRRGGSPGGVDYVNVLNKELLVELRGLEPLTPSMPWRCATSCATAPSV